MKMEWIKLNKTINKEFIEARMMTHHATQIISLVQRHILPEKKDDSHASLLWDEKNNLLVTQRLDGLKLGLKISTLSIIIFDNKDAVINTFSLEGKTRNEVFDWLKKTLPQDLSEMKLQQPFPIPPHDVENGAVFKLFDGGKELEAYFSNAHLVIKNFVKDIPQASELRCWPHHFDYASLVVFDSSEKSYKSIGIGLSPGDENINSPYFYMSPYPAFKSLSIKNGSWYDKSFFGAVLTAEDLLKSKDQTKLIKDYLKESYEKISAKLLA